LISASANFLQRLRTAMVFTSSHRDAIDDRFGWFLPVCFPVRIRRDRTLASRPGLADSGLAAFGRAWVKNGHSLILAYRQLPTPLLPFTKHCRTA
jgi:hypothetical protein